MPPAISARRSPKAPLARRERKPGRLMIAKIVRFYPDELRRIERAARRKNVVSSRFIAEAALDEAARA
jgi:hypothetical protein